MKTEKEVRKAIAALLHNIVDDICARSYAELKARRWDLIEEIDKEDKRLVESVGSEGYDALLMKKVEIAMINAMNWDLLSLQFTTCPSCGKVSESNQKTCPCCGAALKGEG